MKLKEYLKMNDLTYREFAKISGIDPMSVANYINKKQKPSLQNAHKIFKATHGQVSFEDLQN